MVNSHATGNDRLRDFGIFPTEVEKRNCDARTCLVCKRPPGEVAEIDQCLVDGEPYRSIAKRFAIGESAVFRHQKSHVAKSLVKARESAEAADADKLLDRVTRLLNDAQRLTNRAEKAKQLDTALRGIREVRGCLQLLGQVSGELKTSLHVTGNLTVALKGLDEAQIKQALQSAGAGNWHRIEDLPPGGEGKAHLGIAHEGRRARGFPAGG